MPKHVTYNPEARQRLLNGINIAARAASVTMGCSGPAVLIQHATAGIMPVFTRDGVTVVNAITLEDRIENLGARMLREVAGTVSRQVGDGTTTAVVLARALANECMKSIAAGFLPQELKQGMDLGFLLVEKQLRQMAVKDFSADWVEKLAGIASKDEPGIGPLLARAIDELGAGGKLNFRLGNREDELSIVNGSHYEQGYLSPYFVTDKTRGEAVLEQPFILLYDREIVDLMELVPLLEAVAEQGRPLLVIAEGVTDRALAGLLLNHVRGIFKVVAVKPPGYGDKRIARLSDLALLTGGKAVLEHQGSTLAGIGLEHLGQAARAVVTADSTSIVGGHGDPQQIADVSDHLKQELKALYARKPGQGSATGNQHDANELEARIAMLAGKTGEYAVGGITDIEIRERMVRIQNAYLSAQAALEEGVLPGGGIGLHRCRTALEQVIAENAGQQQGLAILGNALSAPLRQLLKNSGLDFDQVVPAVDDDAGGELAYDMQTLRSGPFLELGVIDAVKVMRLALQSAVSVVATLMTSESVIMDSPDPDFMAGYSPEWAAATREDPRA